MKVIVPPKIEPVSIAEVKNQIGIQESDTQSDALITRRISEARHWAEGYTGRAFIEQTREIRWDCFVDQHELPSALTVVSVKYIDPDGTEQTESEGNYLLDTYSFIPFVWNAVDLPWPATRRQRNAVRIQFTAGYGATSEAVPPLIKEALILTVGHWMNFQEKNESGVTVSRVPYAVLDLLNTFRLEFL